VSFLTLWEKTLRTFWNHLHNVRWYDYTNIMFFSLSIITLLSSLYSRVRTMVRYLHTYRTTPSLPPPTTTWPWCSPPLVQNHAKTWWGLGRHRKKIYRWIAGVSAHWFGATAAVPLPLPLPRRRHRCAATLCHRRRGASTAAAALTPSPR